MSRNGHSVTRSAQITGSDNHRAAHSRSERRRSKITAISTVSCDVQFEFLLPPKTDKVWITTKFAGRSSDIRYRDGGDNMSHPHLIADERTDQARTFARRNDDACCACGWRTAGNTEKGRHKNNRRDRQVVNCAESRATVEHSPFIQRCAMSLGSGRVHISDTRPNLVFEPVQDAVLMGLDRATNFLRLRSYEVPEVIDMPRVRRGLAREPPRIPWLRVPCIRERQHRRPKEPNGRDLRLARREMSRCRSSPRLLVLGWSRTLHNGRQP
jgi:hypothetical protein